MVDRRFAGLLDEPDIEEVLSRAEDLLARSRGQIQEPPPSMDLPTLTEVDAVPDEEPAPRVPRAVDPVNLHLEMLAQLAPVLERLVEARVVEHLGPLAASIAQTVKDQLEREIKFIVRDAIDQALLSELERVESARKGP